MKTIANNTKILNIADINVKNEVVQVDLTQEEHRKHFNDLIQEYRIFKTFSQVPIIRKDNEGINCGFYIEVLKELNVSFIEVRVVDNNPFLNELQGINFRLNNLELTNIKKSELISRKVKILKELNEKEITKTVSEENKISQKTVQNSIRIDSIEEPLKQEIEEKHSNIGVRQLVGTSDCSKEQQEQIKEELEENSSKGIKVDNKGYKIILDKVKNKSILDNENINDNNTPKGVKKGSPKKRDIFKETIKLLMETNQQIQKGQKLNDTTVFNTEFLKIQTHFSNVETFLTQQSNNINYEEEKNVS